MREKNFVMKEIWLEIEKKERDFILDIDPETKVKKLTVRGEVYHFENIYSYSVFNRETIKIKLTNARKVFP